MLNEEELFDYSTQQQTSACQCQRLGSPAERRVRLPDDLGASRRQVLRFAESLVMNVAANTARQPSRSSNSNIIVAAVA